MTHFPEHVVDAIRRHAEQVKPGREVVGLVACRGDRAVRYIRLRNSGRKPGYFRLHHRDRRGKLRPGERGILVHSHPSVHCFPSEGDMKGANWHWLGREYAIYSVGARMLGVFNIHRDRKSFTVVGYVQA